MAEAAHRRDRRERIGERCDWCGVSVGVRLVIGLNWIDPDGDGKLRIEEAAQKMFNLDCLFDISGS